MNSKLASVMSRGSIRQFMTSSVKREQIDISHIKKYQKVFQEENGLPVFLKKGGSDKFLFYLCFGLVTLTTGMTLQKLYEMAYPRK